MTARDTATTAAATGVRLAGRELRRRSVQTAAATTTGTTAAPLVTAAAAAAVIGTVVVLVVVFVAATAAASRNPAVAGARSDLRGLVVCAAALAAAGATGETLLNGTAVAAAESGCVQDARNFNPPTPKQPQCPNGSLDRGPWQINDCYHREVTDACADDFACAAQQTLRISAAGTNWTPWATWNNGAAAAAMTAAAAAIATLTAAPPVAGGDFTEPDNPGYQRLTPTAKHLYQLVVETFGVTDIGGWRPVGSVAGSDHPHGRALDVMTRLDRELGWRIADWTVANATALQVKYVIFNGRIWHPGRGWSGYQHPSDPCNCNPTLRHDDHVHISTLT